MWLQHVVLTLLPRMIPCGVLSREDWVHVATSPTKSSAQLLKMPSTPLFHECSNTCHRGYEGASNCMFKIKVHIQIHLTCNQEMHRWFKLIMTEMTSHCFLYGDFSPTLYFTPTCDYYLLTCDSTFYLHVTVLYTHICACILYLRDFTIHLHDRTHLHITIHIHIIVLHTYMWLLMWLYSSHSYNYILHLHITVLYTYAFSTNLTRCDSLPCVFTATLSNCSIISVFFSW